MLWAHDCIAMAYEELSAESLGEEVRVILGGGNLLDCDSAIIALAADVGL